MDEDKRAALLTARDARATAREAKATAHADLLLELEDKYETTLGARGSAFQLVNEENACDEGPIVVKPSDAAALKLWRSKEGDTPEDALMLIRPCVVYPDAAQFLALVDRRPDMVKRCVTAVLVLAGAKEKLAQGKF